MTPGKSNFTIYKGSEFHKVVRWEAGPIIYKTITAVPSLAPVNLTVPNHGMPNGWRLAIQSVKGMTALNAKKSPPATTDYHNGTVVDTNTIEINSLNALDYAAYTSGGVILYNTPVNLTGYTARMTVKDKLGGAELLSLTTENTGIVINNTNKTIEIVVTAVQSELFTFNKGVYDLELVNPSGKVTRLLSGSIKAISEVTT